MPTFTTTFTPPAEVSGFELAADIERSAVDMTWDASAVAAVDFDGFRVYRSTDNGISWTLLARLAATTDTAYTDYLAPLNTPLLYRVTQATLDFESEPVEGSVELTTTRWWIVVPGDTNLTFSIPKLRSASVKSEKAQEEFRPVGRPGALVVGDVVHTESGDIAFLVLPDNLGMVALARAVQARMEGGITLKATDGSIWEVQFGDMSRTFTSYGGQELSIPFTGVG